MFACLHDFELVSKIISRLATTGGLLIRKVLPRTCGVHRVCK
jgi:hypothetical protein